MAKMTFKKSISFFSTVSDDEITSTYTERAFVMPEGIVYPQIHNPPRPSFDVRTNIRRNERSLSPISSRASSGSELVLKAQVDNIILSLSIKFIF